MTPSNPPLLHPPLTIVTEDATAASLAVWLHALLRFARVVRFRWWLVAATMVATMLLGALFYVSADRVYEAKAQLLVQQTGPVVVAQNLPQNSQQQGMLPTYEQLIISTVVLEGVIQRLTQLPRELRPDLLTQPRDNWVPFLRRNLTVRSVRSCRNHRNRLPLVERRSGGGRRECGARFLPGFHEGQPP